MTRRPRELLVSLGVTPVHYAVLKVVAGTEGVSGAKIGARMVLDSASVTGVVDRLEALGLVMRMADRKDRRVHRIVATEHANHLITSLDAAMDRLNAEAWAVIGDPDSTFLQRLRRLADENRWNADV